MKRTASMRSRVPPAVTTTRRPASGPAARGRTRVAPPAGSPRAPPSGRLPPRRRRARRARQRGPRCPAPPMSEIVLRRRMLVHRPVHRRGDDDGAAEGEVGRGKQVVGDAGGHLGERVRRRRGDDHNVAPTGRLDVLEPAAAGLPGAVVVEDGRLGDGGERERHHEAACAASVSTTMRREPSRASGHKSTAL